MDKETLDVLVGTLKGTGIGIGALVGSMVVYDFVRTKLAERRFRDMAAEEVGRSYEENLPRLALYELLREEGIDAPSLVLYNVDLLERYHRMHPEKRAAWQQRLEYIKTALRGYRVIDTEYEEVRPVPQLPQKL